MDTISGIAVVCFWASAALVVYAYAVYPILVRLLARAFGRVVEPPELVDDDMPTVSLVLAAFNEEAVIEDRLRNALAMEYPAEKWEVIVGSDGSEDRTGEIVGGFADRGVRLLAFAQNRGKASVLNSAVAEARGEIVLMSDANTHIDPAAARKLVRWFRDPRVGSVVGRLVLVDPRTGRNVDGLYWKYETFLKRCEGRLGALLGANGAIYAIRKDKYEPIPPGTIVDDFVIPLLAKLRTGCTIVYDPEAVATEETAPDVGSEFHRRARIGAGGYQSIGMLWGLLDPRLGWVAFAFLSHKILRWLCPFFLVGAFVSNVLLLHRPSYRPWLLAQVAFYATACAMALVPGRGGWLRPLRLTTMFTGMNMALLVGFWRWLQGTQKGTWTPTARLAEADGGAR
jgi:cellulose synthase/poly-beta-1,6-N-acetylglucosamine synthase-like glycosyltransferase